MENRRAILQHFVKVGNEWAAILRSMAAPSAPGELRQLRDEVDGFIAWAEAGLHALVLLANEKD
ncbi:TPA: hypothetical protein ACYLK9_006312 [Burkholderia cenocepacia]|uniref:hypothetical protein n=1 Tax=Burkholderia cenocepacia TaxID=95486 RepID=UPI00114C90C1|nr:hypothetical protein [Burkholderia cenocepacia]